MDTPADDIEERLAQGGDGMTPEIIPPDRTKKDACEEEGHLLHDAGNGNYCMRCPYTEPVDGSQA